MYDKTLRWSEPWWTSPLDTGLCNRIFHWEIAYDLNLKNKYKFHILIEEKYWPENKLIELPDTKVIKSIEGDPFELERLKFITVFDVKNRNVKLSKPIYEEFLNKMYDTQNFRLDDDSHYHSNFGYNELERLYKEKFDSNNRPLKLIKLRHSTLEQIIKKEMSGVVGVHIRRGNGVPFAEEDLDSLPKESIDDYKFLRKYKITQYNSSYKFHKTNEYFDIMDRMIQINPSQKFYLSADMSFEFTTNFYNRYKKNMVDIGLLRNMAYDYLLNGGYNKKDFEYGNVVENVLDLFCLSYCDFLIMAKTSTWSIFARDYTPKFSVYASDDWETYVKEEYLKFQDKIKNKN